MFRKVFLTGLVSVTVICLSFAQEKDETITLKGKLQFENLEGGVWLLEYEGKKYDLHGDLKLKGFKAGDEVEVKGKIAKDKACIHMCGIIFEVESIKKIEQDKKDKPREPFCWKCLKEYGKDKISHLLEAHFKCEKCNKKSDECKKSHITWKPPTAKYCSECGKKEDVCPVCGKKLADDKIEWKFDPEEEIKKYLQEHTWHFDKEMKSKETEEIFPEFKFYQALIQQRLQGIKIVAIDTDKNIFIIRGPVVASAELKKLFEVSNIIVKNNEEAKKVCKAISDVIGGENVKYDDIKIEKVEGGISASCWIETRIISGIIEKGYELELIFDREGNFKDAKNNPKKRQ